MKNTQFLRSANHLTIPFPALNLIQIMEFDMMLPAESVSTVCDEGRREEEAAAARLKMRRRTRPWRSTFAFQTLQSSGLGKCRSGRAGAQI